MKDKIIGELVEDLIYMRDKVSMSRQDRDLLAKAINLISHNFDPMASVYDTTEAGQY